MSTETTPDVDPTPNIAELDALLAWAEAENAKKEQGLPSEWDQGHWAVNRPQVDCGTACCIAGKAIARAGGVFLIEERPRNYIVGVTSTDYAEMPDGREVDIESEAQDLLGLTYEQSCALFDADNDINNVRAIITAIKDGTFYQDDYDII